MIGLHIFLDEHDDGIKQFMAGNKGVEDYTHQPAALTLLKNATHSGKHAITLCLKDSDGRVIFWQTTASLFMEAAKLFQARIAMDKNNENN